MIKQLSGRQFQIFLALVTAVVAAVLPLVVNIVWSSRQGAPNLAVEFRSAPYILPPTIALSNSRFNFVSDVRDVNGVVLEPHGPRYADTAEQRDSEIYNYLRKFEPESHFGILRIENSSREAIDDVAFVINFEGIALVRQPDSGNVIAVATSPTMGREELGVMNPGQAIIVPVWFDEGSFISSIHNIHQKINVMAGSKALSIDFSRFEHIGGPSPLELFAQIFTEDLWLFWIMVIFIIFVNYVMTDAFLQRKKMELNENTNEES